MKTTIKWVPGGVPPKWGYYLVTTEDSVNARGAMEAWWHPSKNQWEHNEFTLRELGLTVVAYAEWPEPWREETGGD